MSRRGMLLHRERLPEDFQPAFNDVILGRRRCKKKHPGNIRLHRILMCHIDEYDAAVTKREKITIVSAIMDELHPQHSPGRFVNRAGDGRWECVGLRRARETVAHSIRKMCTDRDKTGVCCTSSICGKRCEKLQQQKNNETSSHEHGQQAQNCVKFLENQPSQKQRYPMPPTGFTHAPILHAASHHGTMMNGFSLPQKHQLHHPNRSVPSFILPRNTAETAVAIEPRQIVPTQTQFILPAPPIPQQQQVEIVMPASIRMRGEANAPPIQYVMPPVPANSPHFQQATTVQFPGGPHSYSRLQATANAGVPVLGATPQIPVVGMQHFHPRMAAQSTGVHSISQSQQIPSQALLAQEQIRTVANPQNQRQQNCFSTAQVALVGAPPCAAIQNPPPCCRCAAALAAQQQQQQQHVPCDVIQNNKPVVESIQGNQTLISCLQSSGAPNSTSLTPNHPPESTHTGVHNHGSAPNTSHKQQYPFAQQGYEAAIKQQENNMPANNGVANTQVTRRISQQTIFPPEPIPSTGSPCQVPQMHNVNAESNQQLQQQVYQNHQTRSGRVPGVVNHSVSPPALQRHTKQSDAASRDDDEERSQSVGNNLSLRQQQTASLLPSSSSMHRAASAASGQEAYGSHPAPDLCEGEQEEEDCDIEEDIYDFEEEEEEEEEEEDDDDDDEKQVTQAYALYSSIARNGCLIRSPDKKFGNCTLPEAIESNPCVPIMIDVSPQQQHQPSLVLSHGSQQQEVQHQVPRARGDDSDIIVKKAMNLDTNSEWHQSSVSIMID